MITQAPPFLGLNLTINEVKATNDWLEARGLDKGLSKDKRPDWAADLPDEDWDLTVDVINDIYVQNPEHLQKVPISLPVNDWSFHRMISRIPRLRKIFATTPLKEED